MIWIKGATPLKVEELWAKLHKLWKSLGKWGSISLDKGYYNLSFSYVEDLRSVQSISCGLLIWDILNSSHGLVILTPITSIRQPLRCGFLLLV